MSFKFSNSPIGRFRLAGISEGFSFVILLFIAMPLKYFAGFPDAVKYVGWAHGLLFVIYVMTLMSVKFSQNWNFKKTVVAFLASLIPFGTFILDKSLVKEEKLMLEARLAAENAK